MQEIMEKFPFNMLSKLSRAGICFLGCHVRFGQLFHFLRSVHSDSNPTQFSLFYIGGEGEYYFCKMFRNIWFNLKEQKCSVLACQFIYIKGKHVGYLHALVLLGFFFYISWLSQF